MAIRRIFVEKKKGFDIEAQGLFQDLRDNLLIGGLEGVRVINRYDIEGMGDAAFVAARALIFSDPPADTVYDDSFEPARDERVVAIELLPGQFDQRADSAAVCAQILTQGEKPAVRAAKLLVIKGNVSENDFSRIKKYCINPIEAREASLEKPASLESETAAPEDISEVEGFITADAAALAALAGEMGFAMDSGDLVFCQSYFRDEEKRNPTCTELRVIDTYWSDHCRHTTFLTELTDVAFDSGAEAVKREYDRYLKSRETLYKNENRPVCLMDVATIAMKELKAQGRLTALDESEEINACSIEVMAEIGGKKEPWLVMFKNETHNHPTEIEPFGGAATCLGGAIRDPLSGRSYVYQAMRVTGSGDPRQKVTDTLPGKLPQRKITKTAAAGYSSYGNQIGLATGQVAEIYDEGYIAKRMEIGAVIGAAPKKNVVRSAPGAGDVVILLGGRTGRDGCGGATGSSKAHSASSLESCGAEVQKGNPAEERKIQRLFKDEKVTKMIKRCNDFGAGGVSVAVGELADGLEITLDCVPKKYEGLDGTELAISESQERMAVVVAADDAQRFIGAAAAENLEATVVAEVTEEKRLVMNWRGKKIVNISRAFLNTNGARKRAKVRVLACGEMIFEKKTPSSVGKEWLKTLSGINVCSQKGLVEMFDSTIGGATVLMPHGGLYQKTPAEGMAAKLPVSGGESETATLMAYGFDPKISKKSPFHGAAYAVVESVAKIAAMGGDYEKIYLTFQEYFERLGDEPSRWGKPLSALLGAYSAQRGLGLAAIGGKDSMSGSFEDLDVPPTLVSFAVAPEAAKNVLSPEFKHEGSRIFLLELKKDADGLPDYACLKSNLAALRGAVRAGDVLAASVVKEGGVCAAVSKMCFGNMLGVRLDRIENDLFDAKPGSIIVEAQSGETLKTANAVLIGETTARNAVEVCGERIWLKDALAAWEAPLEQVFPTKTEDGLPAAEDYCYSKRGITVAKERFAKPRVFIPVFPGTNCEFDSARAFEKAGAAADVFVFNNLSPAHVENSLIAFSKHIRESQIIMIPGGFSGGDDPDGSGKFIATAFRNARVKDATMALLKERGGLMLGICNGFQALIKLGLVPYGEIRDIDADCPTLTFNAIGRHVSKMVYTKVVSTLSPWFNNVCAGDVHAIAVSHGEGRFVASESLLRALRGNAQIATRYCDLAGKIGNGIDINPNGSADAVEGITDMSGQILGKMGHSERKGKYVAKNICGNKDQLLFEAGVKYFG